METTVICVERNLKAQVWSMRWSKTWVRFYKCLPELPKERSAVLQIWCQSNNRSSTFFSYPKKTKPSRCVPALPCSCKETSSISNKTHFIFFLSANGISKLQFPVRHLDTILRVPPPSRLLLEREVNVTGCLFCPHHQRLTMSPWTRSLIMPFLCVATQQQWGNWGGGGWCLLWHGQSHQSPMNQYEEVRSQ